LFDWTCGGCKHTSSLKDFYVCEDEVWDYRCPQCQTTDNELLKIPRITLKEGKQTTHFYIPSPKQVLLHMAIAKNVLWGGRAGTGKSHGLRMDAYMRCLTIPNYRVLLLRRQFTELKDTHLDKSAYEAEKLGARWRAADYTVVFANGSRLRFGHCETDQTVSMYLSSEFDCIMYDEGSTFTEYAVRFINSRLRTAKKGVVPCVRIGSNPGAMWLYRYYISKDVTTEEDPSYDEKDYLFIPTDITDNPHINLAEQQARIMSLPSEALRRMYGDGDWLAVDGQFFGDWKPKDRETGRPWHVINELPTIDGKPIDEVPWIEIVRSLDWGYDPDQGVVHWWACLPGGRYIAIKEFTFNRLIVKKAAEAIKKETGRWKVRYTVAGHDCWMSSRDSGESIQETFHRAGVPLRMADTNRINGWQRCHALMQETYNDGTGEVPLVQVYGPGCPGLVRTLPMLRNHPKDAGDIMQESDHWADSFRYFAMSRPSASRRKRDDVWRRLPKEIQKAIRGKTPRLGTENIRRVS
jgi:phage terminase large subunit